VYNAGTQDAPIWTLGTAPVQPATTTYWNNTKDTDWKDVLPKAGNG
jgi:hypothetical protein